MINKFTKIKLLSSNVLKHPLFSGSFIIFGGSMFVNVINYVYHLVMGRMLGPVGYGILASIFSLLYIVSIIPLSTSISIVKFISTTKNKSELSEVYFGIKTFAFKLSLVLLILFTFISVPLANFLHITDIFSIAIVGLVMFFSIITLVNQATLQGLLKFNGFIIPNLVLAIVKLILGVILVLLGFSVAGAVGGILTGSILSYLISLSFVSKYVKKSKNTTFKIERFIKYSIPVLFQAFAFTSIFSLDLLLAKHFLSPLEAGIYASLSTLGKVIYFATSPIASVMFPIISKRHAESTSYKKILFLSLITTFVISLSVVLIYYLFPEIAIKGLFGSDYLAGADNLVWMGVFMIFYSIAYLLVNYFLSIGKTFIVILPIIASIVQGVLIFVYFHSSATQIIQVSIYVTFTLMLVLLGCLKNEKL